MTQAIYIDREMKFPKFIQQHKSSIPGNVAVVFMYYSNKKHEMTDIYTVAIWTIKYKRKEN
jgi:hypothetical protein